MSARVILIGCVADKSSEPRPARSLYTSQLFLARRGYAEASGCPWGIVSARIGNHILNPDETVAPYDRTLDGMRREARRQWELDAGFDAYALFGEKLLGAVVEVHAGAEYVASLRAALIDRFKVTIEVPLAGLAIGQQLAWYKARRAKA